MSSDDTRSTINCNNETMGVSSILHILKSYLNSETPPPNKVIKVSTDRYASKLILERKEGLILYAPSNPKTKNEKPHYEILFNVHFSESVDYAFSLFRSEEKQKARNKFISYKHKIPQIIDLAEEMSNEYDLQRLCDVLTNNPTLNIAHLASVFQIKDAFKHKSVIKFANIPDEITGISPLQAAVSSKCLRSVKILMGFKCSLEHCDHDGNNVFHYAASTTKNIISVLTENGSKCTHIINSRNRMRQTPLDIAFILHKEDCIRTLILGGADVTLSIYSPPNCPYTSSIFYNYVESLLHGDYNEAFPFEYLETGGTLLHWAQNRLEIEDQLNKKCSIDARNLANRTALHMMVLSNRFECVVSLLSHHANPDLADIDGNTPIHLAVKEGNVSIIQTLIIFGADLEIVNKKGETPRHAITTDKGGKILYLLHAVGASRCPSEMFGCTPGCRFDGTFNGIPTPKLYAATEKTKRVLLNELLSIIGKEAAAYKKTSKKGRLLCLDGGGIRGLILIEMLLEMEKMIDEPINKIFDWIAGTSTGGILALGIAAGKTLQECFCLYFRIKEVAFVGVRPYPSDPLEEVLKESFGTDTLMSEIVRPKLLITGVLADRKPLELYLFRNYPSPRDILESKDSEERKQELLWHVARATGAAPTYFKSFGRYLDGGLMSNNPTIDALSEIHEHNLALRAIGNKDITDLSIVVSLGTGLIPPMSDLEVDVSQPKDVWDSAKLVNGVYSLGNLLVDQATSSDGTIVDRARAWCSSIGVPYYRFSPQMSEDIPMDEKSDEKLVQILWETKVYIYQNLDLFQEVANLCNL